MVRPHDPNQDNLLRFRRGAVDARARKDLGKDAGEEGIRPDLYTCRSGTQARPGRSHGRIPQTPARAEDALRELRASGLTLFLLTSRTGERIAAAERWLERRGWSDVFDRKFYNEEGQDADRFKAGIIRTQPIDVHVDDDPETVACLSRQFPDKLFIRMDHYRRKGPQAGNIVTVHAWDEVPALFAINR